MKKIFALLFLIVIIPYFNLLSTDVSATDIAYAVNKISYKATKTSLTISWDQVDGADAYRVRKFDKKEKKYIPLKIVKSNKAIIDSLLPGSELIFDIQTLSKNSKTGKYKVIAKSPKFKAITKDDILEIDEPTYLYDRSYDLGQTLKFSTNDINVEKIKVEAKAPNNGYRNYFKCSGELLVKKENASRISIHICYYVDDKINNNGDRICEQTDQIIIRNFTIDEKFTFSHNIYFFGTDDLFNEIKYYTVYFYCD